MGCEMMEAKIELRTSITWLHIITLIDLISWTTEDIQLDGRTFTSTEFRWTSVFLNRVISTLIGRCSSPAPESEIQQKYIKKNRANLTHSSSRADPQTELRQLSLRDNLPCLR